VESAVKKIAMVTVGAILVLAGVTFGLQGLGVIGGSAMSGKNMWAVTGPLIAVVGVVLVVTGRRGSARTTTGPASRPDGDHSSESGAAR
jgi:divalent metal cation (Fe/Co/Zn/Cd) transporter